ncbi:MAG: hypothetical protein IJJ64_11710 [Butyrivibrio sp.]|nr:hypothetical protein [Butyrivibrio sp.]MBQ7613631.1 hypothetical protein [Butyrivibrio sp.]
MEIMHVWVIYAGICVVLLTAAISFLLRKKRKDEFSEGIRAAGTHRIKATKIYKSLQLRYKILYAVVITAIIGCAVSALFLVARPYKNQDVYTGIKKRDIILCLDVSYSLYDLNSELTDYLKGVVKGLSGDRIGVSIFNTSTVTYVPLTDDYDYVVTKLDELSHYFELQKELYEEIYANYEYTYEMPDDVMARYYELMTELDYYDAGTLLNNEIRGSSLIGEGLGTALYSFPYLGDSERTRVIIMSSDNQLNAHDFEIMDLDEAAEYCKKNKVTVFGLFPSEENFYLPENYDYNTCYREYKRAVEKTGGLLYVRTPDLPVSAIVQDIQKQEVMTVNMIMSRETQDLPREPFIALIAFLGIVCVTGWVLQK